MSKRIMINQEYKILNLFIYTCFYSFKYDLLMLSSKTGVACTAVFRVLQVTQKLSQKSASL